MIKWFLIILVLFVGCGEEEVDSTDSSVVESIQNLSIYTKDTNPFHYAWDEMSFQLDQEENGSVSNSDNVFYMAVYEDSMTIHPSFFVKYPSGLIYDSVRYKIGPNLSVLDSSAGLLSSTGVLVKDTVGREYKFEVSRIIGDSSSIVFYGVDSIGNTNRIDSIHIFGFSRSYPSLEILAKASYQKVGDSLAFVYNQLNLFPSIKMQTGVNLDSNSDGKWDFYLDANDPYVTADEERLINVALAKPDVGMIAIVDNPYAFVKLDSIQAKLKDYWLYLDVSSLASMRLNGLFKWGGASVKRNIEIIDANQKFISAGGCESGRFSGKHVIKCPKISTGILQTSLYKNGFVRVAIDREIRGHTYSLNNESNHVSVVFDYSKIKSVSRVAAHELGHHAPDVDHPSVIWVKAISRGTTIKFTKFLMSPGNIGLIGNSIIGKNHWEYIRALY